MLQGVEPLEKFVEWYAYTTGKVYVVCSTQLEKVMWYALHQWKSLCGMLNTTGKGYVVC